jgi:hypothetical protein
VNWDWQTFKRRAFFAGLLAAVVAVVFGDKLFAAEMYNIDGCTLVAEGIWGWIQSWFCPT